MKNNNQQANRQANQPNNQQNNQQNNQTNNQLNNQLNNQPNNQLNNQQSNQQNITNCLSALDALTKQLDFEAVIINNNNPVSNVKVLNTKSINNKSINNKSINNKSINNKSANTKSANTKPSNTNSIKSSNTKKLNSNVSNKKTTSTKTANTKTVNTKAINPKVLNVKTSNTIELKKNKKEISNANVISNDLDSMDIKDLDDEIKKLEQELKLNKNNDKKNKLEKVDIIVNEENKTILSENEINESKKALIKLFLEAQKSKKSNDSTLSTTPIIIDKDDKNIMDNTDNMNDTKNFTNSYEENFNVEDFDQTYTNEAEVMEIDFNDAESAKLIKVIDDEDNNYSIPSNVKIRSTNPNNSFVISRNNVGNFIKGCVDFEINSSSITSFDCYNDYMANLTNPVNITDIKIKNIELPINSRENINKSNNELKIVIDNKEQIFELEENYYNRYEIKDFLNEAFSCYNFDINCDIQNDNFIFSSNNKFVMINHETSILPTLGFNRAAYVNRNMYSAENCHQIGDNIFYMIIENISEQALFYINNDSGEINKLQDIEPMIIDHLIIKFYKTQKDLLKNNKDYKFFFDNSHFIAFELVT